MLLRCESLEPLILDWWRRQEDRLNVSRNPHRSFAAASDCRAIAIYEYAP
jgi:hypothetical protein